MIEGPDWMAGILCGLFMFWFHQVNQKLKLSRCNPTFIIKFMIAFALSMLAGQQELVLASLHGNGLFKPFIVETELQAGKRSRKGSKRTRTYFSRHNSPHFRALTDRSGRPERL